MKKILLAAIAVIAVTTACFADAKTALFADLKNALYGVKATTAWTVKGNFKEASFNCDGKKAMVFYGTEDDYLIGFSIEVGADELPATTEESLQKKFPGWEVANRIMYINENGVGSYYLQVNKGTDKIVLSVGRKGKVHFFANMP